MPEEERQSAFYANKLLLVIVLLLAVAIAVLLPSYIRTRSDKYAEKKIVFELTALYTVNEGSSTDYVFKADVRNDDSLAFDQVQGDLEIYVNGQLAYECQCTMSGRVDPGKTKHFDFGTKDVSDPGALQPIDLKDVQIVWTLTFARWQWNEDGTIGLFYNQDKR